MIKSVTVTNPSGEHLTMDLFHPEPSGFIITKIDGIGPGKANINSTEMASVDGAIFNSAHTPARNITISLMFYYDGTRTIEEIRHASYRYFPLKKKITLEFETDERLLEIDGYVESNEPDIFSKEEGCDLSIICPNPFFQHAGPDGNVVTIFTDSEPSFEFPFENASLSENLLEFGTVTYQTQRNIFYDGDADTGILISMHFTGDVTNPVVFNETTGEFLAIDTDILASMTGESFIAGDDVVISTIQGSKSLTIIRDGQYNPALPLITEESSFIKLVKGDNLMSYSAETGAENIQLTIENRRLYEGV